MMCTRSVLSEQPASQPSSLPPPSPACRQPKRPRGRFLGELHTLTEAQVSKVYVVSHSRKAWIDLVGGGVALLDTLNTISWPLPISSSCPLHPNQFADTIWIPFIYSLTQTAFLSRKVDHVRIPDHPTIVVPCHVYIAAQPDVLHRRLQ